MPNIKIISDFDLEDDDLIKAFEAKKNAILEKNRFEDDLQNELLELAQKEYIKKYKDMISEIIEIIKEPE